ncbi:TnpV protein [Thomasclavelia sp.]
MKEIEYIGIDGLLYPNLKMEPMKQLNLARFGRIKLNFLKEHHKIIYTNMLTDDMLNEHLQSIEYEANQLYDKLIDDYKKNRNVAEELKEKNQLEWIQEMNNLENCVMEVILMDVIYSL